MKRSTSLARTAVVLAFLVGGCERDEIRQYQAVKDSAHEPKHSPDDGHDHGDHEGHDHSDHAGQDHSDEIAQTAAETPESPVPAPNAPFAPFAGRSSGGPPAVGQRLGPVVDEPTANARVGYTVPDGWQVHGVSAGGMRVVALSVADGDALAEITFIPLRGDAGGKTANVNRWRKEINLPDATSTEVDSAAQPIEIAGEQAYYFDLEGEPFDDASRFRTLVAMAPHAGQTWFIKMIGPAELVAREKPNFEALLGSIQFKD